MRSIDPVVFLLLSVVVLLVGIFALRWLLHRVSQANKQLPEQNIFLKWSALFKRRPSTQMNLGEVKRSPRRIPWRTLLELGAIALWAIWFSRDNLSLDPHTSLEYGSGDYLLTLFPYYPLTRLAVCGDCVMWNGLMNGGAPTFADSIGALFHPVMMPLILGFGVLKGMQLAMIAALIMGGWAQWWIAKVMRLGRFPRLWVAFFAVVAGHLAGPLQGGDVGIVFSIAAASLVIAPALSLAINGRRRDAILFGWMLGQAFLAGQGYLQLAIVAGLLPALCVFLFRQNGPLHPVWKEFALAIGIAVMIAMPFILPFSSMLGKINRPSEPRAVQSIEYLPLNLVIRNMDYFVSNDLEKIQSPNVFLNYIGWIPIILVAIAWRLAASQAKRLWAFFITAIFLLYLLGSGLPLLWFKDVLPGFLTSIRCPPYVIGLAVSLILALAGWGLDMLLKKDWPILTLTSTRSKIGQLDTRLFASLAVILAIIPVYQFNHDLRTHEEWPQDIVKAAESLQSSEARWVDPVFGSWTFVAAAIEKNVKVTNAYRIWDLNDRPNPPMSLSSGSDPAMKLDANYVGSNGPVNFVNHPDTHYAYINTGADPIPCDATADGGHIDVTCDTPELGQLIVYENNLPGWTASVEGTSLAFVGGQWLSVNALPGKHVYQFRYLPWNVPVGLAIAIAGLILSIRLWRQPQSQATPTSTS